MNVEHKLNEQDEQRLYRWLIHGDREAADASQQREFTQWLAANPHRQQKADAISGVWNSQEFITALQQSASEEALSSPSSLTNTKAAADRRENLFSPKWLTALGIAASILFATFVLDWQPHMEPVMQVYQTQRQQVDQALLEDGTTLLLGSASRVNVAYQTQTRHVELLSGEALFQVQKDKTRPFVVETAHVRMEALGTSFNVYHRESATELRVLEGQVAVNLLAQPDNHLVLHAGEQILVSAKKLGVTTHFDPQNSRSWRQGWLHTKNMRLQELLIELNRYAPKDVIAGSRAVENLPIKGSFDLANTDKNLEIIAALHHLEIQRLSGQIVLKLSAH
ncbi:FecR family protein [Teredinibacter haidensis]|uniref:FecR family protein n=1 Tax=Teredinibacter haidensis TaxID=2731755 RepID=UPI000948A0B7|nr:FecR domain-containing protein [Teredinibacter haidensis]